MNLDEIYITIEEAKKELVKRQKDLNLIRKVEEFLGESLPDIFKKEPRAILSRGVLTPNYETNYFLDVLDLIELRPICAEFHSDKFCCQNKDKVHLGKLVFLHGLNKKNEHVTTKKIIIDFTYSEKKSYKEMNTIKDKSFIEFHHFLYKKQYKELMDVFDFSLFKKNGENALEVYKKFFSLCLVYGVLFENFIAKDTEHEKRFTEDVVLPAYEFVLDKFKKKPLIVPLLPLKNEEKEVWMWYPGHLEKEVDIF